MKKILMIAAMMVATVSAKAQFEPGTFSIQPKMGVNAAWLTNMEPAYIPNSKGGTAKLDKMPAVGVLVGVECEYQLTDKLSLAAGVNYSQQGQAWEDYDEKIGDTKYEMKDSKMELGYINLPITANFYLFKGFAVKAGAQFGFLTNASAKSSVKASDGNSSLSSETDIDFKDNCKKFDLSIPIGVSYQFNVPVVIDLRYNLGLTKVNKDESDKDSKNNVISLTVGYKFKL